MTTITPEQVLHFARQLSPTEQRWLVLHLQEHLAATLPEHATLDEAVGLYLVEACSLGRAAELAGVTRWDILDAQLGGPGGRCSTLVTSALPTTWMTWQNGWSSGACCDHRQ